MKITKIVPQIKRPDRYSIYVDGKYAFSLSDSALLDNKLVVGQVLDKLQLKELQKKSAGDKLFMIALRYVTLRPRSQWEMEQYLMRKKASEADLKLILNKLSVIGLLDDRTFARLWVENRRLMKPMSQRRLRQELKQKRIDETIITDTLHNDSSSDLQTLRSLIDKKRRQSKYRNDSLKLMQYLARQGYDYQDIKSAIGES